MRVIIALMTKVKLVVILFVIAAANEPDRSCCGWGPGRNHRTVSNEQSELSCVSGDDNEDIVAWRTTNTHRKISNSPYIVQRHNFIFIIIIIINTITLNSFSITNEYTELSRNTCFEINAFLCSLFHRAFLLYNFIQPTYALYHKIIH
jgi:hypothetical protein